MNVTRNSDAAFVLLEQTFRSVLGQVYATSTSRFKINAHYGWSVIPVGATVITSAKVRGYMTGKIVARDFTATFGTDYKYNKDLLRFGRMYKLVKVDFISLPGDSGAPVMSPTNSSGYNQLYGILVGTDGKSYSVYSPVDIILSELGLSRPVYHSDGTLSNN